MRVAKASLEKGGSRSEVRWSNIRKRKKLIQSVLWYHIVQ